MRLTTDLEGMEEGKVKTCVVCGKDLPRPVDEFGDLREPVCMGCWFDGEPGETRYEIERLETEIELCNVEIELCNVEIAENQSTMFVSELEDLQEQIKMYEKKIQRLRDKINPDRAKLNQWIMGSPLIG